VVARETAELHDKLTKTVGSIGISGDTRDHVGITALHRPRGAPECHDAAGAAGWQEFEEAR
jgi:hypothetical protein